MQKLYKSMVSMSIITLLTLLINVAAFAQQKVTGVVTDKKDQQPLPGVTVTVLGTPSGINTDIDGKYSLTVKEGQTLQFNFVGYMSKTIKVGLNTVINVQLEADSKILGEVVVTALGIKKDKAKLGYAVQEVKGDELIKAREPNPVNALVGKVSGLTVGASAELLGSPSILLRGKQPLFVVDGVPISSDTWNISSDDIETYTVLKGPAASALYGSNGQFGAVQITTKRGSKDTRGFSIDFNSSTMAQSGFNAIPKIQDMYGPGDHGKYEFVDGKGGGKNDADYDIWGPALNGQLIAQYDSPINPSTGKRTPTPFIARGKDNLTRFLQTGLINSNNIAVATSGEKYDLRFSSTYSYQRGLVPNTQLNGLNFNVSAGYNFSPKLRFESAVNYNRQFTPNYPDVNYGPNSLIYNMVLWGGADWSVDDMKNYWQEGKEGTQQIYAEYQRYNNPWFVAKEWLRSHHKTDMYGHMSLNYKFTNYLNLSARTQITTYDLLRTEKLPYSATTYGREQAKGDYREDMRNMFENNTDVLLNFDKEVVPSLDVKASLGANLRTFNYHSTYSTTDYLNIPGWYNLNNSLNPRQTFNYEAPMQVFSSYAYLDLMYKNFLSLSLTGRVDKSSTMPTQNNTFFYPSIGTGVVLSELIKMPTAISYLKLRGSYAKVGNTAVDQYISSAAVLSGYNLAYGMDYTTPYNGPSYKNNPSYSVSPIYNNQPGSSYTNILTNPDLQPGYSSAYETGAEMKFLGNRLGVDASYFSSLDGPRIFELPLSQATGYSSFLTNGIKSRRSGWELTLTGSPFRKINGFKWDVMVNWSTYKEVLTEIYPGIENLQQFLKVGDRLDKLYTSAFARTQNGQIINDDSGRPIQNPVSRFLGNMNPDWTWSFNNKFSYKQFTFGFQFDGRVGGKMVDYVLRQTMRGGRHIKTVQGAWGEARANDVKGIKSFIGEGVVVSNGAKINYDVDGNITNYDQLTFATNTTPTYLQDYISRHYSISEGNLIDKTYAKLREVTIGFNLPKSILNRMSVQRASISLVGRNLLYFAKVKDVDLDQFPGMTSQSSLQTPTSKSYGINLNITF
ncbi:SusC/RagA family TonB-linked outer membrane protein [Solitalea lacus]|uniref:SusC/RagA family TonB-linked outer membrane protein n=1 Tax=Solitalea lacus TaxID=2911172 RepID=UPI001ED9D500|nr:SusC/RagA family TonB-linked outer membrane protein [Solitalea lacus]UKJ08178.1 SusC/RagA family TonB-linked outer membrane protein [Solitalea lacus]